MAKRTLSGFLAALVIAMMVGMREAVGIAPPPPLLSTEEIHWLSPELEHDLDGLVEFVDPAGAFESGPPPPEASRPSALRRVLSRIVARW